MEEKDSSRTLSTEGAKFGVKDLDDLRFRSPFRQVQPDQTMGSIGSGPPPPLSAPHISASSIFSGWGTRTRVGVG